MNRLQAEQARLYLPHAGGVRAAVMELVRPAGWEAAATVWRGVQADMGLPAPGIAVSGHDAYQLWFSLAEPVPPAQALALLEAMRLRLLPGLPAERIRLRIPEPGELPPQQAGPERWSAFLAPDLAPLFDQEPWLDHPPGADAQAELLSRLRGMAPQALARVMDGPAPPPAADAAAAASPPPPQPGSAGLQPREFLLQVMRDTGADLRLRVDAAIALLAQPQQAGTGSGPIVAASPAGDRR